MDQQAPGNRFMDLSDWISRRADFTPEKPAILFEGGAISYASLADQIDRFSQVLGAELAVKPGDRVAYLGLNSPELISLIFACARVGAILLPLNWRLAAPEHAQLLQHARPLALFAEGDFSEHIDGVKEQFEDVVLVRLDESGSGQAGDGWTSLEDLELASRDKPAFQRPKGLSDEDGVLLCYTSGTTGIPKGALLSKNALFWNAVNSAHMHDLTSQDTVLTLLPMFHIGGLNIQTIPALHAGATVVMHKRFDTDLFFQALENHPITLTLLVPTILLAVMADTRWADSKPHGLRMIAIGSTVVPGKMVSAVCDWGVPLVQVYGSTETGPIAAYTPPADAARKPASTGKTAVHCEIRLANEEGSGEEGDEVAVGEKGEILVRGPNVMTKYWGDAEATREAFTGRWFHTGDIGHFDEEGFLYVDGRIKDMIISGGENIYPALIENLLSERDEIEEIAVVGLPDDYWGEIAVAVVAAKEGHTIDAGQVLDYCSGRIASYSRPREVIIVDQLPRNAMGKIVKKDVRELALKQSGR
jgi:fatty-acyl-CoA synthase